MKKLILIFAVIFVSSANISAKDYILEQQGKRTLVKEHIYSDTDNLKVFKPKIAFKAMLVTEHFSHVSFILNFFILFEF